MTEIMNGAPVLTGLDQAQEEGRSVSQLSMMRVVRRFGGKVIAETDNLVLAMALFEIDRVAARRLCERLDLSPEATSLPLGVMEQDEGKPVVQASAA